uniref:Ovule protein n=1 Tax=Romanomermis culicivorax TaxID=13658 RepID=A0A915HMB4_ROMCU
PTFSVVCPTEIRKKKSSIKEYLFPSSTKFQKVFLFKIFNVLARGIYLASIFYTDDKILTTADDGLP